MNKTTELILLDTLLQEIRSRSAHRTLDRLFDSDLDGKDYSAKSFIQSEYGKSFKAKLKNRSVRGVARMNTSEFMLYCHSKSKLRVNDQNNGELKLKFTAFKRRKTPASCEWSGKACIFCNDKMSSTKKYGRRTHTVISSQRNGNININEVGYMTRNRIAGISAHYNCLFFTPGKEMIQDFSRQPEQSLEGFDISAIKNCVEQHSKRKCCFCSKAGAVATCANLKCKKTGWYHFPCGLKNGSVQNDVRTFCYKCGSKGRQANESKEERKESVKGRRKRKRKFKPTDSQKISVPFTRALTDECSQLSQLSQSSLFEEDLKGAATEELEVFDNNIDVKLIPVDCLDYLESVLPSQRQIDEEPNNNNNHTQRSFCNSENPEISPIGELPGIMRESSGNHNFSIIFDFKPESETNSNYDPTKKELDGDGSPAMCSLKKEYFESDPDNKINIGGDWENSDNTVELGTEETVNTAEPYQDELRRIEEGHRRELENLKEEHKIRSNFLKEKAKLLEQNSRLEKENLMLKEEKKAKELLERRCKDYEREILELKNKNNNEQRSMLETMANCRKENLMLKEENKAKESLERKCKDYERQIQELKNKNNEQRSLLDTMINCANEIGAKISPETSETSTTVGEEINNEPPSKKAKNI